mmetsp:Transcript_38255/g.79565  ORF Transcript_38255/g.79565 Transcript_38255/m.79565 type:complete len:86 (+) Transcript_38255:254-511(+)
MYIWISCWLKDFFGCIRMFCLVLYLTKKDYCQRQCVDVGKEEYGRQQFLISILVSESNPPGRNSNGRRMLDGDSMAGGLLSSSLY